MSVPEEGPGKRDITCNIVINKIKCIIHWTSVYQDLETFIERIKNGEINKETIPEYGDWKDTFLLCVLTIFYFNAVFMIIKAPVKYILSV